MPPKIKLRHSQARMLKDGPAKKTVSAAYILVLLLALAAAAGACWFFREDIVEFWQPKLQDLADQPAKIQAAQAALQTEAQAKRPAPDAPEAEPADAPASSDVVAWEVDFSDPAPPPPPVPSAAPAASGAPAGAPAAPDPEAAKLQTAYNKACGLFNAALAAYQEVRQNPTLAAKRDEAERDAQTAVRLFTALRGKLPETVPLEKHLADAESLLRDTRALHRALTVEAPAAADPRHPAPRTASPTRTATATRTAEATRTAGATRTVGATRTAEATQTAKPTAVRAPDYNK
jgi:hypothetical protein